MKTTRTTKTASAALLAGVLLLGGCGFAERLGLGGGPRELSLERPGAIDYRCDGNRRLTLLFEGERSAWVIMPEREFRLDAVSGEGAGRYSNGRTHLTVSGDTVSLQEGNTVTHGNCRRAEAG